MYEQIKEITEKYGFQTEITHKVITSTQGASHGEHIVIKAKNLEGQYVKWFAIIPKLQFVVGSNTGHCNVWLYLTRPDLTADMLVKMFTELGDAIGLKSDERELLRSYVDPEDWQEIAGVSNAHEDARYMRH